MKLKDLYNSTKVIKSSSLEEMAADVESESYIEQTSIDERRFYPNVDFSDPSQFAIYGSAEKYYTDAFLRIRTLYPYDGSEAEKTQWINESTFIDKYIFDHKYPRYNGYVNLGYPTWGTLQGAITDGYGKSDTNTFIKTFGGPNKSDLSGLENQFGDANKLDTTESRESNLKFDLNEGVTIEMWVKKPAFDTSKTEKEVLFDLWNGEASSSAQYGRLRLELTGASSGSPFLFTALSGTSGVQNQSCGQNVTTSSIEDWTHIALSLKNSGSDLATNLYINGDLNHQQTISSAALNNVTGSIISYIGALQTAPSGSPTIQSGAGKFSGSMDEFRYWKTERTAKEVGRYYWNTIGGGTNTDKANTKLGVYYKFNEGITQTSSYDSVVLDYSGRVTNGTWTGYQSGARTTDSAMVLAGVLNEEVKDPTIRSNHPEYISTLSALEATGSHYDMYNNSSIFHTMPQWILEDDDTKEGNLRNLTQIIASYFDNMHIHVKEINRLKDVYSHFQTKTNDENNNTSTSGSVKPLPFADRLLTNANFVAPELFSDASVLEKLATRSEDENYEMKLNDVKNQIYQNVYSGLTNTLKEKGTNKGFRNILHAFGIDEEVVKINFYGNNVEFELKDRHSIRSVKEKFIDFNNPDRFNASLYQISSGSNVSFITGSTSDFEKFIPLTFETQVVLPNKLPFDEQYGFSTPFTKSVIAGMHQATSDSDYTIANPDNCDIQMYVERDEVESKRVKFHLSSSALGVHLSSSLYEGMYDNNEWLFAFKLVNDKHPNANLVLSSDDGDYTLHFLGYNTVDSTELNSFVLTSSVASADAQPFLTNSKRIYAGAKRTNFTGSLEERTDIKLGFVRLWYNELSNETIKRHSYDGRNYGAESPFRSAYLMQTDANDPKVPEIDTLILNWNFSTLSTSDSNGEAIVLDATSGSADTRYNSDFEAVKNKFYFGKLDFMPASDEKAIDVEYMTAARSTYPEILQGDDMIEIRTQDDNVFTKETLPQEFYIAFEKSMAQTVSQEMINFMSSVTDFNNLIGRPVEKYRMEYKALSKLRQLFFERVSNEPDLDKYIDYYKWLDDALGEMLVALVPASLAHSDGVNNVIENYVFSRDKYTNKFPTIEFKAPTPEGGMNTINRHLYPWKQGHAPVGGTPENENCFWWLERAERDEAPLSGSASGSNNTRVKIFQARNSVLNRSYSTPQHFAVDRARAIHGGTNYDQRKRRDSIWSATKEVAESPLSYGEYGGFPLRYVLTNNDMFQALKDCNDDTPVPRKIKRAFSAVNGFQAFHHDMSGGYDGIYPGAMVMPFNIMSSSVTTGYSAEVNGIPGVEENIDIVNVHSDTTDNTNEIPMQSPFTERWVGGHQHRHAPINDGNDTEATRGEGYKILINNIENNSGSIGIAGADYPYPYANQNDAPFFRIDQAKARYYREERAKRPLNVRNIETSGSQVGNFNKRYQFVHTFGRNQNKTFIRDIGTDVNLHNATNTSLPQTNLDTSLVARGIGNGNLASNFNTSSLYLADVKESNSPLSGAIARDTVIANKFSAPGGFETMSEVFLDMYGKEKSAYNALPFRNLMVRGSGSGEEGSLLHLVDIHGNRYGLRTHLTRHSSWGGVDSVIGNNKPSFHKVNRNPKWDAAEEAKDYDNYWIQHQIPQSDFQYKWVKASHTASLATSSLAGHVLSDFSEPSGTTSKFPHEHIDYAVVSQSVTNQRITGTTVYGYPSWEQIRNNDTNKNVVNKKSYGYSLQTNGTSETIEESRITENIPMYTIMKFKDEIFRFVYPYVNMKYHFDNTKFDEQGVNPSVNETIYDNVLGYYKNEDHEAFSLRGLRVRQNLFPDFLKHTKYNVRHRHYFVSKFWTDGENVLYNPDTGPDSYLRLDEVGRRQQNVTASLFSEEGVSSLTKTFIDSGQLTNIIPSQSIWNMDSRTDFTSSNPQIAASNSAGAPGVLQNQDHHFHNGVSELLVAGQAATGSFITKGATVFGTPSSGSFRVQGMVPTGIKATGSFEVTGATVFGEETTWGFTMKEPYVPGASASMTFDVGEATTLGQNSVATFDVSGAAYDGALAVGEFTVSDTRTYSPPTTASLTFQVSGANSPITMPSASVEFGGLYEPATYTTGTFTVASAYRPGDRASTTFDLSGISRYGDRLAYNLNVNAGASQVDGQTFTFKQIIDANNHNDYTFTIYKTSEPAQKSPTCADVLAYDLNSMLTLGTTYNGSNTYHVYTENSMTGFNAGDGVTLVFNIATSILQTLEPSTNSSVNSQILELGDYTVGGRAVEVYLRVDSVSGFNPAQYTKVLDYDLIVKRHYATGEIVTTFKTFFGRKLFLTGGGHSHLNESLHDGTLVNVMLQFDDTDAISGHGGWTASRNGSYVTSYVSTTNNASGAVKTFTKLRIFQVSLAPNWESLGIYDKYSPTLSGLGNLSPSDVYNSGQFVDLDNSTINPDLVSYYRFGDENSPAEFDLSNFNGANYYIRDCKGSNHLRAGSNSNASVASKTPYAYTKSTRLKTDEDMAKEVARCINCTTYLHNFIASTGSLGNKNKLNVYKNAVGATNAVEFNLGAFDSAPNLYSSIKESNALDFAGKSRTLSGSGDSITDLGTTSADFIIRHSSPLDVGQLTSYGTGSNPGNDPNGVFQYAPKFTRSYYIPTSNTNGYIGLSADIENFGSPYEITDITFSAWVRIDGTNSGNSRYIYDCGYDFYSYNSIQVYTDQYGDNLYIKLISANSQTAHSLWQYNDVFDGDRFVHLVISIDRSDISQSPTVWINGVLTSYDTSSSSGTIGGVSNSRLDTLSVGDYDATNAASSMGGFIADIAIWSTIFTNDDAEELYNKGRWRDHHSHPKAGFLNNYWEFDASESVTLPSLNQTAGNIIAGNISVSNGTTVPNSIFTNNESSAPLTVNGSLTKVNYGIVKEYRVAAGNVLYKLPSSNWFDVARQQIQDDSDIFSATSTPDTSTYNTSSFEVTRQTRGVYQSTPGSTGTAFTNIQTFSGGSASTGILSSDSNGEAYLGIQYDANGGYTSTTFNTTNFFIIKFFTGDGSNSNIVPSKTTAASTYTSLASSGYAEIDVTASDVDSDAELWTHVLNLIKNFRKSGYPIVDTSNSTRTSGGFTLYSYYAGLGNTDFVDVSSAGSDSVTNVNNSGGDAAVGAQDQQRITIPYLKNLGLSTEVFDTATFEVDTATGNSNTLTNSNNIPLPALPDSQQGWQRDHNITSNSTLWDAYASIFRDKLGDQYEVTSTDDGTTATFVFTLKQNLSLYTFNSSSWDNRALTPGGDPLPSNTDFTTYQEECGVMSGDYVEFNVGGTTKRFQVGNSNTDNGNTRIVDGYGVSSAQFRTNLKSAIEAEIGTVNYTTTYSVNVNGALDCEDVATFTIEKAAAGAYDFNITTQGTSFFNESDVDGVAASGFGNPAGSTNRLQIGNTTMLQASTSTNTFPYVDRSQTQSDIINTILTHMNTNAPGSNYTTTVAGSGNSRTFTVTANAVGSSYNATMDGYGQFSANDITGGENASGSVTGDYVTVEGLNYTFGTITNATNRTIDITGRTDDYVWGKLHDFIEATSSFNVTYVDNGSDATFTLTSKVTGSNQNDPHKTLTSNGGSFDVTQVPAGGSDETGATAGDYIELFNGNPEEDLRKIEIITTGNTSDGDPDQNGDAISYVNSVGTNSAFWDSIQDRLEYWGYGVVYFVSNNQLYATFTVQSYLEGTAGDQPLPNNGVGGSTFSNETDFNGGLDASGATPGSTLSFKKDANTTKTYTLVDTNPGANQIRCDAAGGITPTILWNTVYNLLNDTAGTNHTVVQGNDSPRTFSMTYYQTGAFDPTPAVTGDAFVLTPTTVGTEETGARAGDTITIDNQVFTIVHSSNPNPREINASGVSNTQFLNALKTEIINSSSFTTASYAYNGVTTLFQKFSLTASTTGTVYNISFDTSSANQRTFDALDGAAGGTDTFGLEHLDGIVFEDSDDISSVLSILYFRIDTGSSTPETPVSDYRWDIGVQDILEPNETQTDAERSQTAWNRLSASIKAHTVFGNITIEEFIDANGGADGEHHAIFHITSSKTGSLYDYDITTTVKATPDDAGGVGFTIVDDTSGGTDQSGATPGDTITIDGVTFTLVTGSAAGAGEVLCGTNVNNLNTLSNNDYFNNLASVIEASTSLDPVTYATYNTNSGSFELTSSVTGAIDNVLMTETGDTFTNLSGMSGGYDPVYLRFKEIIPQPRYNYPHVLTSPGSLRTPTAKSSLGLISADYKLRSNHFNLTRSLGESTDGLYDNTSRWTTPDLSGLTPFDSDYDTWYENIRGHNKHFSLVPEFRISSHVKDIVQNESSETEYFKKNYWLEITGTSADSGSTVNRNTIDISGNEFLKEYSISADIKNMENFIEENRGEASVARISLTCDAIMSFLPYEGFYPQSRTVQMCEAFANSYGRYFLAEEADENNTDLVFPDNNAFAQSRPIFDAIMSPGLLYNTIKSGMAVDYPIITSKLATASLTDPYGGTNYMVNNEYFDDRLPFETLINPEAYLAKKRIVDVNPHVSSSVNLRTQWNGLGDANYKLMSNNFFAESIEFFLEGGKTSRIISKPDNHPDFGVVIANHAGILPVYRSIFKVYKSKKQHPWVEFKGVSEVVKNLADDGVHYYVDSNKVDKYYYRPPSGTNYFLSEYEGLTGSALEYDVESVGYPRPQMNPYAEVETITMYSQPNAFGPPCAGGVAVEFKGLNTDGIPLTGKHNNTTYMMYDSTNGYNAPFTPPYYDGEAWAIYTFTPERAGKHTLSEILQNTTVEFLRYELNHESGSYGDRGTFGPQGFAINENAMQIDASFNLFKQVSVYPAKYSRQGVVSEVDTNEQNAGKAWVIESKFETPILDFSKYLNRPHNAAFESDVSTSDIHTASISLSGTRSEPDVLSTQHSSLAAVHELSGILNPIGMWHQYGEFPESDDKGIFMQMIDVPADYTLLGTEMTIANPKYTVVKPDINDCDGAGLDLGYNKNPGKTMLPYFKQQEIRRKLVGKEDLSVLGSSIQLINKEDGIIIDAELNKDELVSVYGTIENAQSSSGLFRVFSTSSLSKSVLTTDSAFTSGLYHVFIEGTASSASYPQQSSGAYQGNWATAYYNYDRAGSYTPILIETKDYASLRFDYGKFSRGLFEDFLKEFSIGIKYTDQSADLSDRADISCVDVDGKKQIVPVELEDKLVELNPSIKSFAKIDMSDKERRDFFGLKGRKKKNNKKFKGLKGRAVTKRFKLIPDNPAVASSPSAATTSSYDYPEPTFVRASIRYDAGSTGSSNVPFENKVQMAPQNDKNFAGNASTVRWGKFMHSEGSVTATKSLAELVGFSQEKVKMGVTAQTKTIREAVVAIPYIGIEDNQREFLTLDKFEVDKYLFQNNIIPNDRNARNPNNRIRSESTIGDSIRDQIDIMRRYSLPPHLDFIENDIDPLPMYIFEFEKVLDRDDLNGIWQGVRTESLKKVEFKQKVISHDINVNELLGGLLDEDGNGIESLKDVKWMIFKVKQKGARNYDKKMESDLSDGRFGFEQQNLDNTISDLKYGYNWPYDFFSMVENVKVSVDIAMVAEEKDTSEADNSAGYGTPQLSFEGGVFAGDREVGNRSVEPAGTVSLDYEPKLITDRDKPVYKVIPDNTPKTFVGSSIPNIRPVVVGNADNTDTQADGTNTGGSGGTTGVRGNPSRGRGGGVDGRY